MDVAQAIRVESIEPAARRLLRAAVSTILTLAIVLLPALSATISYRQIGEPPEHDLVRGAMIFAGTLAALAWSMFGLVRVVRRMNFMAAATIRGSGFAITDPDLKRSVLARHDIACTRCGYNLRGLPGTACPECREPIVLSLAGSDPLRPIVWLTRLAVAGYLVFVAHAVLVLIRAIDVWPRYSWQFPGFNLTVIRAGLVLQPVLSFAGLLLLTVLLLGWVNAEAGQPRALARWRVLNVSIALLCLMGLAEVVSALLPP